MADSDGYVRGETLDVFFKMMDEDTLNEIFEEELCSIIPEVNLTSNIYILIQPRPQDFFSLHLNRTKRRERRPWHRLAKNPHV